MRPHDCIALDREGSGRGALLTVPRFDLTKPVLPMFESFSFQNFPTEGHCHGWRWGKPSIARRGDCVARDLNSSSRSHPVRLAFHWLCGLERGRGKAGSCLPQDSISPSVQWTGCTRASEQLRPLPWIPAPALRSSLHYAPRDWQASESLRHGAYRKTFSRPVP